MTDRSRETSSGLLTKAAVLMLFLVATASQSDVSVAIFFALSTAVLSGGQAWVLGTTPPRFIRYALTWIVCSGFIGLGGRFLLWGTRSARTSLPDTVVWIAAAAVGMIALLAGAWSSRKPKPGSSWLQRTSDLVIPHYVAVFAGCSVGVGIIAVLALAAADW